MDDCRSIGGVYKGAFFMAKELKPGDRVQWNTPQGKTTGRVKKKLTSAKKIKGHVAKAIKKESRVLSPKRQIRQTSGSQTRRASQGAHPP